MPAYSSSEAVKSIIRISSDLRFFLKLSPFPLESRSLLIGRFRPCSRINQSSRIVHKRWNITVASCKMPSGFTFRPVPKGPADSSSVRIPETVIS